MNFPKVFPFFGFLLKLSAVAFAQSEIGEWRTLPNAPIADLRFEDVFFINSSIGWIVEISRGKIYKTANGGESWDEVFNAMSDLGYHVGFRAVGFADDQIGWSGNLNFHNNPIPGRALFETRNGGDT